jgi:hypothetical protein
MNWQDIKNIIREELREATEEKYIVVGKKNGGKGIQYGAEYNSKEEAQKAADKKNNDPKYKDISFSTQKGSIKEATTVSAGNTKFNLRTGVNKNPTKLGIKIQFEPKAGGLETDVKSKLEVALQEKLNDSLKEYDIQVSKDTDVPREDVIGFFIPLSQLKNLIVKSLTGSAPKPEVQAPEPEGGEEMSEPESEEELNEQLLKEMRIRDLNEISKVVKKEDFYEFINKGNNILRSCEECGINNGKKYLIYLIKHNIM